jgi:hypothetical protein
VLLHCVFFVTTTISVLISPLFYGLASNWFDFARSLALLLGMCPFVQFFTLFMVRSSMAFIDLIQKTPTLIAIGIEFTQIYTTSQRDQRDQWVQSDISVDLSDLSLEFITALLASGLSAVAVYLTLVREDFFVLIGAIPYLTIVVQIVIIVIPSYGFFWRIATGKISLARVPVERAVRRVQSEWIADLTDLLNASDLTRTTHRTQTFESALVNWPAIDLKGFSDSGSGGRDDRAAKKEEQAAAEQKKADVKRKKKMIQDAKDEAEHKMHAQALSFAAQFVSVFTAQSYLPLFEYSLLVGQNQFFKTRKRILLWVFSAVNLFGIACDIYQCTTYYSGYFLAALAIRILFFPVISNYHVLTIRNLLGVV